jgi:C_GCAxxG_C_C family probable redox protein
MSDERSMSRRASLRSLAATGVAVASGLAAEASEPPAKQVPTTGEEAKPAGSPVDLAVARLKNRHSCAQAVFSTFAEPMGVDYGTAVKVSSGFGGGMHLGGPCGAVTGAIMAIGLKCGGLYPNMQATSLGREFADRFKAKHQSINCPDLIGVDLSKPEGVAAAKDMKVFARCPGYVEDAARILDALLKEAPPTATG